jgi:hypothetical protein
MKTPPIVSSEAWEAARLEQVSRGRAAGQTGDAT